MCWYRHGHLYSYLFHLRVTCKIVSFVVQPHGFFNCSPAVDVPPNTCEIDTKENDVKDNGVPKPTSVGLMAKIWRYSHKTPFLLEFCCRTFPFKLVEPRCPPLHFIWSCLFDSPWSLFVLSIKFLWYLCCVWSLCQIVAPLVIVWGRTNVCFIL